MKKTIALLTLFVAFQTAVWGQIFEPVQWDIQLKEVSPTEKRLELKATIEKGWNIYGMKLPEGGPISTSVTVESLSGGEVADEMKSKEPAEKKFDALFNMELTYYKNEVTFLLPIKITEGKEFAISGSIEFMACNNESCLPPTTEAFAFGNAKSETTATVTTTPLSTTTDGSNEGLWQPVIEELRSFGGASVAAESSLWIIFITGFFGGLLALLTPCVWPMIPMTVSFFLKRTKSRRKAIADAILYGVSIIVIYLLLGLLITVLFGASALNDLSTNAIFNILFFLILVLFGISFLGGFEITLPASWSNKLDQKADSTTGILSIFFMAFTLSLVSFSCTGPIIGTLLVQAAALGSMTGPAIGMFGFALALAIPFALFAIFPSWLKQMPKSGGWLNSVKVVLGFLELALALKFLSVADLAYGWRLLDREVFLVLWIVLFILLGVYLLGFLRFSHDSETKHTSIPRFFLATLSLSFALYMVPGLWGAPLKAISAFSPPLTTQDFNLYENETHAAFDDYESGMAYAKAQGKPAIIDFSGFGCVNCRKMEAAVWTDPKVKHLLENDFVLITLFVDDKKPLTKPIEIEEHGKRRTLKSVGDKWSYLQRHKFGANAQPFYVMLNEEGKPLGSSYSFNESVHDFIQYLEGGLKRSKE